MIMVLQKVSEEVYKCEINGSFIQLSIEDGELVVDNLFVSDDARGNKLGYKLLDLAVLKARDLDLTLSLYAEPQESEGMEVSDLVEYYRDYGFESDADNDQLMSY